VDVVRLDHFRGFEAYWEVQPEVRTPSRGAGHRAPGQALLKTMQESFGALPIIAEDLGVITPEVDSLRRAFELPGMRILQFAFGEAAENRFLPHNFETQHRRLHRHARQRHDVGLVSLDVGEGSRSRAPLSGPRWQRRRLGP